MEDGKKSPSSLSLLNLFRSDEAYYEGVPRYKIYLLRTLYTLMFFFLSFEAWSKVFQHIGPWEAVDSAAWCMWGSYSIISFIGIIKPLKMLPIILFDIVYKSTWLIIVAYPLWAKGELEGTAIGGMANVYIWVVVMYVAMPWRYFLKTYILGNRQ